MSDVNTTCEYPVKQVKLIVWDLDLTLWDGILLEDLSPRPFDHVVNIIKQLDSLGVLQSIASKNDHDVAISHLKKIGVAEYFLHPQIHWSPKSASVSLLAEKLNIGLDSILFVDDQEFELAEVTHAHPDVRVVHAGEVSSLLQAPFLWPAVVTDDARRRRLMYLDDAARTQSEKEFVGPPELFLASLNLEITVRCVTAGDIERVKELISRTNQLNSTGVLFSQEELIKFSESRDHRFLMFSLRDRFGDYGQIGLALVDTSGDWVLELLLVSCRVLSRGIGPVLLNYLALQALTQGSFLSVLFRDTGRNRPMRMALMMTGFVSESFAQKGALLAQRPGYVPVIQDYIRILNGAESEPGNLA
ncbi:HAD family hydrolase [Massilia sp. Root335]|uniref:HAD-IIIC family phosphatase n=1 Tax=Massilia sp. Root335 TaxID=1736517 RepID=UPI0009EC2F75|nr:HAD-IIIC family phosphatase [Massilia sp. Root335]